MRINKHELLQQDSNTQKNNNFNSITIFNITKEQTKTEMSDTIQAIKEYCEVEAIINDMMKSLLDELVTKNLRRKEIKDTN